MIWDRREFLAQFKPQGLGWDLSTVLHTELSTKKRVTWEQRLVIQYVLGCEQGFNSSSALPSAWTLFRRASGWPEGRKLLLGRSSSSQAGSWYWAGPYAKGFSTVISIPCSTPCLQALWFSAKSLLLMPL